MTIFLETVTYLSNLPSVRAWPEMGIFLFNAADYEPHEWRLPILASKAVNGTESAAIPGVASIAALQASIIMIDDMLDGDPRGYHNQKGMPAAANMASALQALSIEAIYHANLSRANKIAIMHQLGRLMGKISLGQSLDVMNLKDEKSYWHIVETKSSPFFGSSVYIGALCGGADIALAQKIELFGNLYGEMIQLHDDLNDVMATPAGPDWLQGRSPLPVLFALTVPHPDQKEFKKLRCLVRNPESLRAAQEILVRCGSVSYTVDQILTRYEKAKQLLKSLPVSKPEYLAKLLPTIVEPIQKLIQSAGGEITAATLL